MCVHVCVRGQRRDAAATESRYRLEYKCDIVGISRCKHATNQQIVSHSYDLHVSFDRFACVFYIVSAKTSNGSSVFVLRLEPEHDFEHSIRVPRLKISFW